MSTTDAIHEWATRVIERVAAGGLSERLVTMLREVNDRVRAKNSLQASKAYISDVFELARDQVGGEEGKALVEEGRALAGTRRQSLDDPQGRAALFKRKRILSDEEFAEAMAWVDTNHDRDELRQEVDRMNELLGQYYQARVPESKKPQ